MELGKIKKVYCIGIGGIGVSGLARYFHAMGKMVAGYDLTPSALTQTLIDEGIAVSFVDDPDQLPFTEAEKDSVLVIYTPAVPSTHKELMFLRNAGFEVVKRSKVLGLIANQKETVAVAGTHGKTSVTGILSHVLSDAGAGCSAFLGGIAKNFGSNLVLHPSSPYMVAEADEFDRSFLQLFPAHAIVTSTDADHLDIYGEHDALKKSFVQFISQVRKGGNLLIKQGLDLLDEISPELKAYTYSAREKADFFANNVRIEQGEYVFDLNLENGEKIEDISIQLPGRVNMENATAAASMAYLLGIDKEAIRKALAGFGGMVRRFDFQLRTEKRVFVDDYAHHPTEIEATLASLQELYPDRKITGVFQPHLFSRTRDFATGFAKSLSMFHQIILLDVYPARELPIEGVDAGIIFDKIEHTTKYRCTKDELAGLIKELNPGFLVTMGAGDIDRLVPQLKELLIEMDK